MQKYTPLGDTATETVKQALLNHEDNIDSIRSSNSGSSFPTEHLVVGMKCYRTDLKATYTYNGTSWDKETDDKDIASSVTTKSLVVSGETSVPTPSTENNSQTIANTEFVHGVVNKLVNGAPSALDTLQELSAALGDDPNFSTAVLNKIGEKESKEDANIEHTALKNAMVTGVDEVASGALKVSKGDGTTKIVSTGLGMNQIIASLPVHYSRSAKWQGSKTTITVPSYLTININNQGYIFNGTKTLDITKAENWEGNTVVTARAGKDFYIYACEPTDGTVPKFVLSANSTVPTGYTATNSRKIGGFHCECADIGTISGHPLSGYVAGDILPASVWDLKHRPISSPEGMVFDGRRWIDIYIASWDGSKLVSKYGGVMADGESTPKWHGEKFEEEFANVGKHLLSRSDFMHCMKGIQEGVNIKGSSDANTTGGHVNTNNVRIVSNYGVEDCAGVIWQWGSDLFEAMSTSHSGSSQYNDGYSRSNLSVYNSSIDDKSYGSCSGFLRRVLFGGGWDYGSACGSRCANCCGFSACRHGDFAGRGASEPLAVEL